MPSSYNINGKKVNVWPDKIDVEQINDFPPMFYTHFQDYEQYHPRLIERLLELEKDDNFTHRFKMGIGGSKVRDVHRWGIPEADLLHARALEYFARAVNKKVSEVKVDVCWASITRKYEYLTIHGHYNCLGAVVYMLTPGDDDATNPNSGRFAIVDPRVPACCPVQDQCATHEIAPNMVPGSMLQFPADIGHFVHPYTGDAPRITVAWNLYF